MRGRNARGKPILGLETEVDYPLGIVGTCQETPEARGSPSSLLSAPQQATVPSRSISGTFIQFQIIK